MHSFLRTLFVKGGRTLFIDKLGGTPFINEGGYHLSREGAVLQGGEGCSLRRELFIEEGAIC